MRKPRLVVLISALALAGAVVGCNKEDEAEAPATGSTQAAPAGDLAAKPGAGGGAPQAAGESGAVPLMGADAADRRVGSSQGR
ncbi:MAG TPA: hypothetical protein VM328_06085 [Fimbriimonadaceae bacterium]|nr:hypothetical protein [Fimbriimonadaceae bacterium]